MLYNIYICMHLFKLYIKSGTFFGNYCLECSNGAPLSVYSTPPFKIDPTAIFLPTLLSCLDL